MTSGIRIRPSSSLPTRPLPGRPLVSRTFLASVAGVVSPQPQGTATLTGTDAHVGQGRARLKLFVLDTHTIYRRGLAASLELLDGVDAVGDAESVREAWESPGLFEADLVVLDHSVSGGRDFIGAVSEATGARVLVCTSDCSEDSVLSAVQAAASGAGVVTPELLGGLVRSAANGHNGHNGRSHATTLTDREQQVLSLIAAGHPTREVAQQLCYSER